MQNLLNIYRASAGAGKTFFLTESFLKLAFKAPDYYKKILAVTFTNKAAEEMKTRITEELNILAVEPEQSGHFDALKITFPDYDKTEIQSRAQAIQNEILHHYSLFSVSTIDSFVQKIIRAFTFEMNLRSNYNLQLDTEWVMADLRERLYEKVKEDKTLLNWLIKFAEYKIGESKSWNFNREIEELSREILSEEFQTKGMTNLSHEQLEILRKKLSGVKKNFEKQMFNISQKAEKAINNAGIDYTAIGQKNKYIGDHLIKKIRNKDFAPSKTVMTIYDKPQEWANKSANTETRQKIAGFHAAIGSLLVQAIDLYVQEFPLYLSADEILKNFYSFGLLSDIASLLPDYRSDNNELLISDTTFLLKELIQNNDAPFIYEKTGNRYNHILIDEFQDTSNFQWENFKPLIKNSLAAGHFNLIVGDIKQSIYGWRGGDWTLLLYRVKEQIGNEHISENNLPYNWRSTKNIVRFNNTMFNRIPELLQNHFNHSVTALSSADALEKLREAGLLTAITDAYRQSTQKIPKKDKPDGYLRAEFIMKETGELKEDMTIKIGEKVGGYINELLQNNHKAGEIGILVRSNSEGKLITDLLYEYQSINPNSKPFDVISQVSSELSKSRSVKIMLAAMRYINCPDDSISAAELVYEYQKQMKEIVNLHQLFSQAQTPEAYLPEMFCNSISELKKAQLYELTEMILAAFQLRTNKGDYEFIRSFQDLVYDFVSKKSNDLQEFLNWWEEKGKQESLLVSDKQNAVKILTVHKSKGLGIEHLIVPSASWSISPKPNTNFWAKDESGFLGEFEYLPLNYKKALANTVFRTSYHTHTLHGYTEALNLLYVALTRAKQSLCIFVPISGSSKTISNVGDLLYEAVKQPIKSNEDTDLFIDTATHYSAFENRLEIGNLPKSDRKSDFTIKSFFEEAYPGNDGKAKPEISYQSENFFIESVEYIAEKVNYGSLMHRIFAGIETPNESRSVIEQLHTEGYITKEESALLYRRVNEIISRPNVAPWFRKGIEVISEKSIITEEGQTRIPDRVIIDENKITVIDFKFGKQRKEHLTQIQEYKDLLEKIYGRKVAGILYYAETDSLTEAE